jgi:hypothetical protein
MTQTATERFLAQCLGDPATVERLAEAGGQAASNLTELNDLLRRDINATIPGRWSGDGATASRSLLDRIADFLIPTGQCSPMFNWQRALNRAAEVMRQARAAFADAEQYANQHGLEIREDLSIVVRDRTRTDAGPQLAETQQRLARAIGLADEARRRIVLANQDFVTNATATLQELSALPMAGARSPRLRARPRMPTGAGAPRVPVRPFQEPLHNPTAHARQQQILADVQAGRLDPKAAGREYERLVAEDLRATEGANRFGIPGRRWDVGTRHEITIEGTSGPFTTHKLNQMWTDLTRNGEVLLTVPRLSPEASDQMARLLAQARTVRPDASVHVRETLP